MQRPTTPKEQLLGLKAELEDRVARLQADRRRLHYPLSQDFSDQATERENDEVVDRLNEAARADLQQVHEALARLEEGRYGICVHCGDRIEDARLSAVPQATACSRCAHATAAA